jgi:hypothetical protein
MAKGMRYSQKINSNLKKKTVLWEVLPYTLVENTKILKKHTATIFRVEEVPPKHWYISTRLHITSRKSVMLMLKSHIIPFLLSRWQSDGLIMFQ